MKNYSGRNSKVDDLGRRLSDHYSPIIARLHYSGVSDRDIVEGTRWDLKYNVLPYIAVKAVERARHTKRFMGFLLAEKMNDRRRNALRNKSSRKDK